MSLVALLIASGFVFLLDLNSRLGIAVWIFYLVPVGLAVVLRDDRLPLQLALLNTLLMVVGYYLSPPGLDPEMARLNRGFGVVTLWAIAMLVRQVVLARLRVEELGWLQDGQARVASAALLPQALQPLATSLLQELMLHTDAQAGTLQIVVPGGLRCVASLGANLPQGETRAAGGLPARVLAQGGVLHLTALPADAPRLSSLLTDQPPRQLLLARLDSDGEAVGVLELLLASPDIGQGARTVQLLERAAGALGVVLRSALYRQRQQELLEETQRQGEELQAQQEELRVQNEELTEQGRLLRASQARLEQQQAELEQSNAALEEQAQELEQQRASLLDSQARLERNGRELEQASRYKSEFLANMSHELRTPLNSSLILSRLLADNRAGNLSEEQVRHARTIHASNNDLLALINDILDLSKIEAGKMELAVSAVPLQAVWGSLAAMFEPLARERGLEFAVEPAPGLPATLRTDEQRLQQVLRNLLSNAVKFTERGSVRLQIHQPQPGTIAFTVADTGIGIPEDKQAIVFEAFQQADGSTSRRYGGTGLGLSISRELARLLGGRIELQSRPGEGSRFSLVLPEAGAPAGRTPLPPAPASVLSRPPAPTAVPAPAPAPAPPTEPEDAAPASLPDDRDRRHRGERMLLVVEDDPIFAKILMDLAHELDFDCLHATRADEAFRIALDDTPCGLLLDLGLPDQSGLSLLDRMKRDPRTRHIPVHVVSGTDYRRTALELGAVGYMLKPAAREQLAEAMRGLEAHLRQGLRRVLVVEDDVTLRESIEALLRDDGVEIVAVGSIGEAMTALRSQRFDCMVTDLTLPDGSGHELLDRMAADGGALPPVIVYTGRALTRDEEQALRRHSSSIIVKGARSPERLLDEVTLFLHRVEASLPAPQQRLLQAVRERDAAFEGRHVLLVEDDVRNVFALSSVLEPLGARLAIARNGREALDHLASGAPVDLVLMDLMMPEMDGLEATRAIRAQPALARLPVIALTAKAMPEDRRRCLDAGANDYISKPIDVDRLLSLCRVWLPR